MTTNTDHMIMRELVRQVALAVPENGNESDVVTMITRPMWDAFCRAAGIPEGRDPKPGSCVYGSRTRVVESDRFEAVSFCD